MLKYKQQCFSLYFNYNLNKRLQQHENTSIYVLVKSKKSGYYLLTEMHTYWSYTQITHLTHSQEIQIMLWGRLPPFFSCAETYDCYISPNIRDISVVF